jgi:hypothetical protein
VTASALFLSHDGPTGQSQVLPYVRGHAVDFVLMRAEGELIGVVPEGARVPARLVLSEHNTLSSAYAG